MTTQIDDQFTNWLLRAFDASELAGMSATQREVMRDTFVAGFVDALTGAVSDPVSELAQYRQEIGTEMAKTKARHCAQEALMIKRAGN